MFEREAHHLPHGCGIVDCQNGRCHKFTYVQYFSNSILSNVRRSNQAVSAAAAREC
jgi:hypothetical protein